MCADHIGFRPGTGETGTPVARFACPFSIRSAPPPACAFSSSPAAAASARRSPAPSRPAGAHVHVCDVDRSALDRLAVVAPEITGSMADASVAADVERVVDDARSALGGLDVLVGHAGIPGPGGPIETVDGAEWERALAVNLHGQFHFARRAAPLAQGVAGRAVRDHDGTGRCRPRRPLAAGLCGERMRRRRPDEVAGARARSARRARERDPARKRRARSGCTLPWPASRCSCARRRRRA